MTHVYYLKDVDSIMLSTEFDASLPLHLKKKIENIHHPKTALEKRKSLYLLNQILKSNYLDINLVDLYYNEIGKPFLSGNLSISNSYSNNIHVTALSTNEFVGIDTEKILPINLDPYQFYFTKKEWTWINNELIKFYTLWTKKEALAKALGIGMELAFEEIELLEDEILYGEKNFYFVVKIIKDDFVIAVASNVKDDTCFKEMIL